MARTWHFWFLGGAYILILHPRVWIPPPVMCQGAYALLVAFVIVLVLRSVTTNLIDHFIPILVQSKRK